MLYIFLVAFGGGIVLSLLLIPLVRKIALKSNFVDMPGIAKIHENPVPYGGGVAVGFCTMVVILIMI